MRREGEGRGVVSATAAGPRRRVRRGEPFTYRDEYAMKFTPAPDRSDPGRRLKSTNIGTGEVTFIDAAGRVFDEHGTQLPPRPRPTPRFITLNVKGGQA